MARSIASAFVVAQDLRGSQYTVHPVSVLHRPTATFPYSAEGWERAKRLADGEA
jgi:hypothetical protein